MPEPRALPERRPRTLPVRARRSFARPALLAAVLLLAVAPAALAAGGIRIDGRGVGEAAAPAPGQSCPDQTPAPTVDDVCQDVVGPDGGGGIDVSGLVPIVFAAGAGAAIAFVAALLFIRRRAAELPVGPVDPGEWWTCRKCGSNNVLGSPRCYACGTWQG